MSRLRVQRGVWREYALKLLDFHTHRMFETNGVGLGLVSITDRIVRDADKLYAAERSLDKRLQEQLDSESTNARIRAKFAKPSSWLIKKCPPAGHMGTPIERYERMLVRPALLTKEINEVMIGRFDLEPRDD